MKRLHALVGATPVERAVDLLRMVVAIQDLIDIPAEGAMVGENAFGVRETSCRVWQMTVAAGLEEVAPGCRGSMRRRPGWATAFFPPERVKWTRTGGPPDGDQTPCAYRFQLI
jgi:hypothetical protein